MGKTIYIVLTNTGTLLSKAIGMYTRRDLNHASIAFDEQLYEMYSFGRKQQNNPFIGGFVREEPTAGIFQNADCAIYKCDVTTEDYMKMRNKIRQFERNPELYKYNFIGLFGVMLKRKIHRKRAFFCSQFVATVMNECKTKNSAITPDFMMPHHFEKMANLETIYEGNLQDYLQIVRGRKIERPIRASLWKSLAFRLLA